MAAGLAIALVNGAMGKLGEIAAQQALNEACLLLNFKTDFKWLEKKLRKICASLQAADEQSEHSGEVKDWLAEVRNIAYDAQDIVDECAVEHLYTNASQSCVCNWSQLVFRYKMGKRIKELKDRITSTVQEAQELKLFHEVSYISQPSTSTSQREGERGEELRRMSILEEDSVAVGIEHKVEELQRLLENPAVGVVAVVGKGGLGKTFLVQHVYNRSKYRYACSAWISVSKTCSLRKLQYDLASNIDLEIDSRVSDVRAAELIHGKLEGKSCLIVLDDVWRSSVEGNLRSRLGLPTSRNNQCKIVVTTRSREVAETISAHIYEMQHLSKEDSWNLFCLFAFPDSEGNRPPERLESLAHQIVEKCGRLPLAVKTVAASLAKSCQWESKLEHLKKVGNAEDSTMKILKLSYDSLPPNLKSCFAYLSFFLEDTKISFTSLAEEAAIHQDYVIDLWIVEGFIPQVKDRDQKDIGLDYLHQLVNLCLVDIDRVNSWYTVHDLLIDLAVNICKEHECVFDLDLPLEETSCRRLLVAKKGIATNAISERPIHRQRFLRTLSFSQNPDITSIPHQLFDHVRLLRVIDFSRTAISTLPNCVGNLKLVKVLNLSHTQMREVPDCVRRLETLQFLDVSFCTRLTRLPHWIGELKCLSYLNVEWCSDELADNPMPKGISQLSSLRRLRSGYIPLSTEENELNFIDVGNLLDLQEIRFRLEDVRGLTSVEDGVLERLVKMRVLGVINRIPLSAGESTLPAFPEKLNVMKNLQQLTLERFSVPSWICGMENLTQLLLEECSDYPSLQKMPNLQELDLRVNSKCTELPKKFGESGGFPKLGKLVIRDFPLLEELPALEEKAMARLEGLWIENCPRVKKVPEGLERLSRLKKINVKQASGELEERLKEGGEDWNRIKANNPHIQIYFST